MRILLLPLVLLTSGCWTRGSGLVDATRYPWDQPRLKANYCVVSLEAPSATGILVGKASSIDVACKPPLRPNTRG